ncbi:MAG: tetratricopeptide repeat protein [Burkholderiales bacterium]
MRARRWWLGAGACVLALHGAGAAPSDDADGQALLQDEDYVAGLAALSAGDAGAALRRFESALRRFPDSADLHNELGFAHRKLRQMDKAFEHYKRALTIDPRHRGAHEYIGEAYLMVDDLASAEKHLATLRSICVLPCEELTDLEKAISGYRAQAKAR